MERGIFYCLILLLQMSSSFDAAEELRLPQTVVSRLVKDALPPGVIVSKVRYFCYYYFLNSIIFSSILLPGYSLSGGTFSPCRETAKVYRIQTV